MSGQQLNPPDHPWPSSTKQTPYYPQFAASHILAQEFPFHHEMHEIKSHLGEWTICPNSIFLVNHRFEHQKTYPN
jgi:hypothetical protein